MKPKQYNISPARGQALLNYNGRLSPHKSLSVTLYETEVVEKVRIKTGELLADNKADSGLPNLLLQGDCLSACAYLKANNISVDLVYIDPPFASGANYAKNIYLRNGGDSTLNGSDSIGEEVMYGDIWQKEDYLNWLYERLLAIRDIMSETASIYVHLDWHIGHYVKIMMDEVFGEENFVNEIIWAYRSGGASQKGSVARKHDAIYFYSKSHKDFGINSIKERQYLEKSFMGSQEDKQGRFYVDTILTDTLSGVINRVMHDDSIRKYNTRPVLNLSKERLDYNTQKPEGLIELLLEIASNEGMVVADFFSGSGTTAKVAHDLGRKFIACDIGINASQTSRDRLVKAKASFDLLKIKDGLRLFRNPEQTQQIIFDLINGYKTASELELNPFWDGGVALPAGDYAPLKFVGMHAVLDQQMVEVFLEHIYKLEGGSNSEIWILYAHKKLEIDQASVNKAVRDAAKTEATVRLKSLDDLLAEKKDALFMPDNATIEIAKHGKQWQVQIVQFHSPYLTVKLKEYNDNKVKPGTVQQDISKAVQISQAGLELIEAVQFDTTSKKAGGKKRWHSNQYLEDKAGRKDKIKGVYLVDTDRFKIKIRNIAGDEIIAEVEGMPDQPQHCGNVVVIPKSK